LYSWSILPEKKNNVVLLYHIAKENLTDHVLTAVQLYIYIRNDMNILQQCVGISDKTKFMIFIILARFLYTYIYIYLRNGINHIFFHGHPRCQESATGQCNIHIICIRGWDMVETVAVALEWKNKNYVINNRETHEKKKIIIKYQSVFHQN